MGGNPCLYSDFASVDIYLPAGTPVPRSRRSGQRAGVVAAPGCHYWLILSSQYHVYRAHI